MATRSAPSSPTPTHAPSPHQNKASTKNKRFSLSPTSFVKAIKRPFKNKKKGNTTAVMTTAARMEENDEATFGPDTGITTVRRSIWAACGGIPDTISRANTPNTSVNKKETKDDEAVEDENAEPITIKMKSVTHTRVYGDHVEEIQESGDNIDVGMDDVDEVRVATAEEMNRDVAEQIRHKQLELLEACESLLATIKLELTTTTS